MNLFILATALFVNTFSDSASTKLDSSASEEKVTVSAANANIGHQPEWGPTGYAYVEYYYLPDIETYYSVATHKYIYFSNFHWTFSALPPKYREVDLYNCYKVVINEPKPYLKFNEHKEIFKQHKGINGAQVSIKNCKDNSGACWKNTNKKVQVWESCSAKKVRRNLKNEEPAQYAYVKP